MNRYSGQLFLGVSITALSLLLNAAPADAQFRRGGLLRANPESSSPQTPAPAPAPAPGAMPSGSTPPPTPSAPAAAETPAPVNTAPGTTPLTCGTPGAPIVPAAAPAPAPAAAPPAPAPVLRGFRRHFVAAPVAAAAPVAPPAPPAPPVVDCTAPSTDVLVISHTQGGSIVRSGATLVGRIATPANAKSLKAEVTGVAGTQRTLQVDATSGQFAFRVSDKAMTIGTPVKVKFTMERPDGTLHEPTFTYGPADDVSGLSLALNRLSFGATPALFARVKQIGFEAYVNEQLSPDTIDDTAYRATNSDTILTLDTTSTGEINSWWFGYNIDHLRLDNAVGTNKQLLEVMTQFWENHFWAVREDNDHAVVPELDELRGYRGLAFGTFRDLLRFSANGQMMDYLDNNTSRAGSINENYARELMELHTVGINGGYTNDDIMAVAAVLTGWSYQAYGETRFPLVQKTGTNLRFWFDPTIHDTSNKTVSFLNRTFIGRSGADGVKEGEELFDLLANHPKTQEFVCGKIVVLLVSEVKPASFVERCVTTWSQTGGHIGSILRTVLLAPDYRTNVTLPQSKIRTPFEFAAAYLRNFGHRANAGVSGWRHALRNMIQDSGQNFSLFPVPTGFVERSETWASPASLLLRSDKMQDILRDRGSSTSNFPKLLTDAGMTTAESAAAYLLALGTGDRFRQEEYDAVVAILKGTEGKLNMAVDQSLRIRNAIGLIVALPSYQLQ